MDYDLGLFVGHGEGDNGAVGNGYNEVGLVRPLVEKVYNHLISRGLNVHTNLFTGANNYNKNLTNGNKYLYNMAITSHINSSSGGYGSEAIVPLNEKYLTVETEILQGLSSLGLKNRGLKSRNYDTELFSNRQNGTVSSGKDWYKEIRDGWSNGCSLSIIEYCFINDINDINIFRNNIDNISIIVSNAILRECNKPLIENTPKPTPPTPTPPENDKKLYRIQVGAYTNELYARQESERLKSIGINNFIVRY